MATAHSCIRGVPCSVLACSYVPSRMIQGSPTYSVEGTADHTQRDGVFRSKRSVCHIPDRLPSLGLFCPVEKLWNSKPFSSPNCFRLVLPSCDSYLSKILPRFCSVIYSYFLVSEGLNPLPNKSKFPFLSTNFTTLSTTVAELSKSIFIAYHSFARDGARSLTLLSPCDTADAAVFHDSFMIDVISTRHF